jgi:4-hydroxythreonine-4-phosphate dehydrogenase
LLQRTKAVPHSDPQELIRMSEPPDAQKPLIVSMGDPAGIGPDLIVQVRYLQQQRRVTGLPAWVVAGDPDVLEARAKELSRPLAMEAVSTVPAAPSPEKLYVLPVQSAGAVEAGKPSATSASATIGAVERALTAVRQGASAGIVTLPIAKRVLHEAGFPHPGHTEFLGALAEKLWGETVVPVMMLAADDELRVVPVTIHVPLADVPRLITRDRLIATALTTLKALTRDFGIGRPTLAVAGLNPHAGESGSIGSEDRDVIAPAVAELRRMGHDVIGPSSADTLFHKAARQRYDACLCMYHDQALIPLKTLAFDRGVNVTLGLPFVRTSPDHGTAFDIAGTGRADPTSFIEALRMAESIVRRRGAGLAMRGAAAAAR